ncbi:MAG: glycosyltransferase family 2 protein [Chitinophagaceae bacterium]
MGSYQTGIILINYNNNADTVDCVKSIASLSGELPFVVVVDNASRERNISEELRFYPHLHTIYSDQNLGFGKANNTGITWLKENVACEFLFILNNDTILRTDTVEKLLKGFVLSPHAAMVTPKILTMEETPKIWYGGGSFRFPRMTVDVQYFGESDRELESHAVDFASGCAMLFRTAYFDHEEGFDPAIFMYDEDVELCLRMKRAGHHIFFVSDAVLFHKCQGSQRDKQKAAVMNQLDASHPSVQFYLSNTIPNRYYILKKYFSGLQKLKIHASLLTYWMMKSAQYMLKGKVALSLFTTRKAIGR